MHIPRSDTTATLGLIEIIDYCRYVVREGFASSKSMAKINLTNCGAVAPISPKLQRAF